VGVGVGAGVGVGSVPLELLDEELLLEPVLQPPELVLELEVELELELEPPSQPQTENTNSAVSNTADQVRSCFFIPSLRSLCLRYLYFKIKTKAQ
jgi:hypothetical protein